MASAVRTSEGRARLLPLLTLALIAIGGALQLAGAPTAGDAVWAATVAVMLVPLTVSIVRTLAAGRVGVDAIALVAMAGALAVGEYLAGAVIALMLSGGNALEAGASRRARRELTALLERMPTVAHRRTAGAWEEVPVGELAVGDRVLVRAGEIVPVDGELGSAEAVVDESALSGEPLPVTHARGATLRSGSANAGAAFELRATRLAADSAYANIVRLVRAAETQRAPFIRLADRYAAFFLPLTVALAAIAWAASGDPVRAVAVLVVATPCPLILAAPIAIVSGVSRAARSGVIVKGGAAIERLGEARTVLLDKTGTLTLGEPAVREVVVLGPAAFDEAEVLRLAASLDQLSAHVLAEALVHEAERRGLALAEPVEAVEEPGQGIEGSVEGRRVAVGSSSWLRSRGYEVERAAAIGDDGEAAGLAKVAVGADGRLVGVVVMADRLREDARGLAGELREAGVRRVAMVTGDRAGVAERIAAETGLDQVFAEQSPEQKLDVVRAMRGESELAPVVMVGDGVNDAPALALADVGIAMAGPGATISSETADAVITVDRIDRVAVAVTIGRRALGIARQSVVFGIGLSAVAMVVAAFGYIPPLAGALLQEGIDVAVILNALRALTD
ncbi:MAG TPA: heavy metal translocating P-type ATPase [Solirubrobacterales bacterium]|nr:heavy metal translocating P-type ATPase [Solirubrobacterales bacterium]